MQGLQVSRFSYTAVTGLKSQAVFMRVVANSADNADARYKDPAHVEDLDFTVFQDIVCHGINTPKGLTPFFRVIYLNTVFPFQHYN